VKAEVVARTVARAMWSAARASATLLDLVALAEKAVYAKDK